MTTFDPYEDWRQARRREEPPDGFSDRVMAQARRSHDQRQGRLAQRLTLALLVARSRRGAVLLIAGAAFVWRLTATLSFFLAL